VVQVPGSGSGTVMIAGLIATKPGHTSRLIYRIRPRRGRKGERKSFSETDYAALLDAAHQQLGGRACSAGTTSTPTSAPPCVR
jgi:hypothetical protein